MIVNAKTWIYGGVVKNWGKKPRYPTGATEPDHQVGLGNRGTEGYHG
jgi:hypothetical protein